MNKFDTNISSQRKNKDRNINIVIIRNTEDNCKLDSKDCLNIIRDNNILNSHYENLNINIILVQNIISSKNKKLKNEIENIPVEDKDLLSDVGNNNINIMVIKNIIPLK